MMMQGQNHIKHKIKLHQNPLVVLYKSITLRLGAGAPACDDKVYGLLICDAIQFGRHAPGTCCLHFRFRITEEGGTKFLRNGHT